MITMPRYTKYAVVYSFSCPQKDKEALALISNLSKNDMLSSTIRKLLKDNITKLKQEGLI